MLTLAEDESVHLGNKMSSNLSQHMGGFSNAISMLFNLRWSEWSLLISRKDITQGTTTTIVCAVDPAIEFGKYYMDFLGHII